LAIEDGADANIKDISGLTPLLLVLSHNDRKKYSGLLSCLNMLLEHRANVNSSDRKGRTACHIVCSNNKIEAGDRFAALKMLVNFDPPEDRISLCSNQENLEVKLSTTEPEKECWQSGLVSVGHGHQRKSSAPTRPSHFMKVLKIDEDEKDGDDEETGSPLLGLHATLPDLPKDASLFDISLELSELSRTQSMARNDTYYSKWRSRFGARLRANSAEVDVEKVIEKCNINKRDSGWRTPLLDAAQHGFSEGMRFLIEMRANVNARTRLGQTPLHRAVWGLHIDCINALLSAGCDMNAQDNSGNTLLHLLAINSKNRIEVAFIDRTLEVIKMVVKLDNEMLKKRKKCVKKSIRESLVTLGIKREELIINLIADFTVVEGANLSTKNNRNVSAYGIAARLANKQRCSLKIAKALHP